MGGAGGFGGFGNVFNSLGSIVQLPLRMLSWVFKTGKGLLGFQAGGVIPPYPTAPMFSPEWQQQVEAYKKYQEEQQKQIQQAPEKSIWGSIWSSIRSTLGFQTGAFVPGSGSGDIVPAMLEPGEFVVNRNTVNFFGPDFFHSLQNLVKVQAAAPERVLRGLSAASSLQFKAGGTVPHISSTGEGPRHLENKMTVVNVMDEASVEEYLSTKKYGDVFVNKLGTRFHRRSMGARGV